MFDIEFWKNFLSNALATFVGVIVGIPVALWINRLQQRSLDASEKKKAHIESLVRKRKILQLIREELQFNKNVLEKAIQGETNWIKVHRTTNVSKLEDIRKNFKELDTPKFELWDAFSDGGELQWIQDLDLLNAMTFAYYSIRTITTPPTLAGEEKLALGAINSALEIIDKELIKTDNANQDHYSKEKPL